MKKLLLFPVLVGIALSGCITTTPKTQASAKEINETLVGNTVERSFRVSGGAQITTWTFYNPYGVMKVVNNLKETGSATYTVKDGSICVEWIEQGHDWNLKDRCFPAFKDGEQVVDSSGNSLNVISGNVKGL